MRSLFIDFWIRIKSSYWFVPSLMCIGAVILAFAAVTNSEILGNNWVKNFTWLYSNQPEGARSLLATVAGSMITVAGVVFSMTLLMVSHASSQIGPRVMEGFMRDRGSQFVLGTFIATFVYCLLVLRTVMSDSSAQSSASSTFVPHLAVVIAMILAVLSVAVLIFFVHHVPTRINITSVIDRIGCTILTQLEHLFPEPTSERTQTRLTGEGEEEVLQNVWLEDKGGYLRVIDNDGLVALARDNGAILEVLVRPGEFRVRGAPLVRVYGRTLSEDTLSEVAGSFSWGGSRTQEQDTLFLVDQLAEIAGRALSPGVNDQFTALACIDQMERVLREACERDSPESHVLDSDGSLRMIARPVTLREIADRFLLPLRQFSFGDAMATSHLIAMLVRAEQFSSRHPRLRDDLRQHRAELESDAIPAIESAAMRGRLATKFDRIGRE